MYNLTNASDALNLWEFAVAMNKLSGGLIGIFLLVSMYLVFFIMFKQREDDTKEVLLTCSAIITIIAVLMWTVGLIEYTILIYPLISVFATIMLKKFG